MVEGLIASNVGQLGCPFNEDQASHQGGPIGACSSRCISADAKAKTRTVSYVSVTPRLTINGCENDRMVLGF